MIWTIAGKLQRTRRVAVTLVPLSGDLLIGNFGDGEINAYALQSDGTYDASER